jgi:hypothetical protein
VILPGTLKKISSGIAHTTPSPSNGTLSVNDLLELAKLGHDTLWLAVEIWMKLSDKLYKKEITGDEGIPASSTVGTKGARYNVLKGPLFARLYEEGKMDKGKSCWLLDWAFFYSHLSVGLQSSAEILKKVVVRERELDQTTDGSPRPRSEWMRLAVSRSLIEAWDKALETAERYHRARRPSIDTVKGNGQKDRDDGAGTAMEFILQFVTSEMAHLALAADCVLDDWLTGIY